MHSGADVEDVFLLPGFPSSSQHYFLARIVKMIIDPSAHYGSQPWYETEPPPYTSDTLYRFCKAVLLFYPAYRRQLFFACHEMASYLPESVHDARQISELQAIAKSPRSLKLLSRLCILENTENKTHVFDLPLPRALKHYVRIGDYFVP